MGLCESSLFYCHESPVHPAEMPFMEVVACLPTFEDLRQHVLKILCTQDHLDPAQTPLFQEMLIRRGKPCGLRFEVQGPRRVRCSALWVGEENRIIFYDSGGVRFHETRMSEAPDPLKLAG
jgi:hypothetical protein